MATSVPVTGYASVADYELRTGTDVPADQEPMVQTRLNDTSALIDVHLGDYADEVEAKYADVLTALTVSHVWRAASVPTGVRSESIGATSVSYDTEAAVLGLDPAETDLLDKLMGSVGAGASGVGQIGITYGGPMAASDIDWGDIDFWILSGGYRK